MKTREAIVLAAALSVLPGCETSGKSAPIMAPTVHSTRQAVEHAFELPPPPEPIARPLPPAPFLVNLSQEVAEQFPPHGSVYEEFIYLMPTDLLSGNSKYQPLSPKKIPVSEEAQFIASAVLDLPHPPNYANATSYPYGRTFGGFSLQLEVQEYQGDNGPDMTIMVLTASDLQGEKRVVYQKILVSGNPVECTVTTAKPDSRSESEVSQVLHDKNCDYSWDSASSRTQSTSGNPQ